MISDRNAEITEITAIANAANCKIYIIDLKMFRFYGTNNNAARFQCGILHVHSKMDIHKRKEQDSMDFWGTKSKFCV